MESVPRCPVCGETKRRLLHVGLTDRIFRSAEGAWDLYQCQNCLSAYLDPRPTAQTIGEAYGKYYTHEVRFSQTVATGFLRRLSQVVTNGYRNVRFGTRYKPSSSLWWLALLVPGKRKSVLHEFRYLPRYQKSYRLLDVGSGSGDFLLLAKQAGWELHGCDPDERAVETAQASGLDVRLGGLEAFGDMAGQFDAITLGHVIEHAHDPRAMLQAAHRLLKSGGTLWLETPNIRSFGHAAYGPNWRGLEPPRHLVLFTWASLEYLLMEVGFQKPERHARTNLFLKLAKSSQAIQEGKDPYTKRPTRFVERMRGALMHVMTGFMPQRSEYITLTAKKFG